MTRRNRTAPALAGRRCRKHIALNTPVKPSTAGLPANWRTQLPAPRDYYACYVRGLGAVDEGGWATGRCPLHPGVELTFHVCLTGTDGRWRCSAGCGTGDLIDFPDRRHGLGFAEAVHELLLFARERKSRGDSKESRLAAVDGYRQQIEDDRPLTDLERAQHAKIIADRRARDEGLW